MSFVPEGIVQDKNVSISIHEKEMMKTVTNVCKAERAATFGMFL